MEKEALLNQIGNLMSKARIQPEVQINSFQKFKTALDISDGNHNQAVVDITNSLGIQSKNDVLFSNSSRSKNKNQIAPVLNPDHLTPFSDYHDLKRKLKELPSEWTVIQLATELSLLDIAGLTKEHRRANPTLLISRYACGDLVDNVAPFLVRIPPPDNALTGSSILDRMQEMIKLRRDQCNEPQKKSKANSNIDVQLLSCVNEVESYWLREWKYLLGGRLADRTLEDAIRKEVSKILDSISNINCQRRSKCLDLLFHLAINAHNLKDNDLAKSVSAALCDTLTADDISQNILKICRDQLKSLNSRFLSAIRKVERYPVILITQPSLEIFPWEMTCALSGHPVCRILSLHFLYALFKYHEPSIHNGFRQVSVSSGFCLLNPEKNLNDCEKAIGEFLKKELQWMEVTSGVVPDPDSVIGCLSEHSLYVYCGHGSGSQYFKRGALRKALVDSIVLLYGCSSNLPQGRGGRTPYQNDNIYTYLTNGCPCTIGALFIVSSAEIDRASIKMLSSMLPTVSHEGGLSVKDPVESDVLKALQLGKTACHQYWTKSCLIARGIPVKIVFNESEKKEILQSLQDK